MFVNIGLPIILIILCPILLWTLAKSPFKLIRPGARFKLTSILILLFWNVAALSFQIEICYWIAGLMLLVAFLIFYFMLWSVLGWGYTIRMVLVLHEHKYPVDNLMWQKLHAGSNGIKKLTVNRIETLKKMQLIKSDGDRLILSHKGLFLAKISRIFMWLFGVSS